MSRSVNCFQEESFFKKRKSFQSECRLTSAFAVHVLCTVVAHALETAMQIHAARIGSAGIPFAFVLV